MASSKGRPSRRRRTRSGWISTIFIPSILAPSVRTIPLITTLRSEGSSCHTIPEIFNTVWPGADSLEMGAAGDFCGAEGTGRGGGAGVETTGRSAAGGGAGFCSGCEGAGGLFSFGAAGSGGAAFRSFPPSCGTCAGEGPGTVTAGVAPGALPAAGETGCGGEGRAAG